MSQQLRDVLHLIVGKLSVASEAEAQALHDLVDEALPEEKSEDGPEPEAEATTAAAPAPTVTPAAATQAYVGPLAG
ncbi:MAG: hypothetical protein M0Z46_10570 [Actinomycetota bacterium]|jgi:hypothetical protein|nr:hypothetical protein [Actinomycetota bacterium]